MRKGSIDAEQGRKWSDDGHGRDTDGKNVELRTGHPQHESLHEQLLTGFHGNGHGHVLAACGEGLLLGNGESGGGGGAVRGIVRHFIVSGGWRELGSVGVVAFMAFADVEIK